MILDDYVLFAAIVEAQGLSAAARTLKLSPAMVSKRLARMERRLGAQLIKRTTRRIALTEVGETFHERVLAILAASREAEALVSGRAGAPTGRLRISAPTSFGRLHIAPRLAGFVDAYPDIRLQLDLTDDLVDMMAEQVDLAVRIGPPPEASLTAHLLAANRRFVCASARYLEAFGEPRSLDQLGGHRLLAATGQLPWRLEGAGGQALIEGESYVRTNSSEVVRELALAGVGIALRSTWDVAPELRKGTLRRLLGGYEGASDIGIYAVHPRADPVPPNVRAFIAFLEKLFTPSTPWDHPISAGR